MRAGDGLWAVGDITDKGQFTHIAVYQGRIAAADILGREHSIADYAAVPRVTFMDPEVASVGLTAQKAHEAGVNVRVGLAETKSSPRGWIHGPAGEHGVIKLVADAKRKTLVGGSVMAPAGGEVVGFLALAVKEKVPSGTCASSSIPSHLRSRDRGCAPATETLMPSPRRLVRPHG